MTTEPTGDPPDDQPLHLIAHLTELRNRLLRAIAATLAVFLGLVYFANDIYAFVSAPLRELLPEGSTMIATEVASPFLAPFKLTMVMSLFVAMPYILHQAWSFVAPALYRREKMLALPILLTSIALFYAGMAFAYYVVFPLIFAFFSSVGPQGVTIMTDISSYLDFITTIVLAFGLAFEVPIATVLLVWTGLTTTEKLGKARPYVFLMAFVVGMLLTPPDIISQTLLAVPVYLLYEAGIIMARIFARKPEEVEVIETEGA